MKIEKVFTITSIVAFFALLPALIILEVRVLKLLPEITYLFVIIDIILVAFIIIELVLMIRKWRKEEESGSKESEEQSSIVINKEWETDPTEEQTEDGKKK
ncbi:MAG: hypothetical protein K9W42_07680 [Candidatus Heimdallarchaeota archaeon]|nr:hypothetical protein [Candidatus Heimdallarchaeota archaeon]